MEKYQEVDLRDLINAILKRWWIIFIIFMMSLCVAYYITNYYLTPVYRAETLLFLGKEKDKLGSIDLTELKLNDQLVNDYREILRSKLVAKEVINELGLNTNPANIQRNVTITTIRDSRFFTISFNSTNPELAATIVKKLADIIIEKANEIVDVNNVQIIDSAEVPQYPIYPDVRRNMIMAAAIGIAIGIVVIMLIEILDHTLKTAMDIQKYLKLNTIGIIPRYKNCRKRNGAELVYSSIKNLIAYHDPWSLASEAYRTLRTNLNFSNIDKKIHTLLVTSSQVADGKTFTVSNLAVCMAQAGKKTLVIDADLRKPMIHKCFGMVNSIGLTDVLVEDRDLSIAIKSLEDQENIYILTCGSVPPNPTEILQSNKMKELISNLKSRYDLIIIDTPPAQLTDAAILAGYVDGILLVISSGETNIENAKQVKTALDNVKARFLGVILTKAAMKKSQNYYKYKNYSKDNRYAKLAKAE